METIRENGENSLAERFCEKYQCATEDFETHVLWRCMYYSPTAPLARLIFRLNPEFFGADINLITLVKDETNIARVQNVVAAYEFHTLENNWMRRWLKIRLSRNKLLQLSQTLFGRIEAKPLVSKASSS